MSAGHHFLPQHYLAGFTDPDVPPRYTPFLWTYEFDRREWRRRSPANFAKRTGYYLSTTEWGETHDLLERSLGLLETGAAPIIKDKIPRRRTAFGGGPGDRCGFRSSDGRAHSGGVRACRQSLQTCSAP